MLALFNQGLTYDEIAEAVYRGNGKVWRPTRPAVAKKFERLGFPARNLSHGNLLPWKLSPEHRHHRLAYMLTAESKKRQGEELNDDEKTQVSLLLDLLFGRGRFLVVGYDRKIGFYLSDRTDKDEDIVRAPADTEAEAESG
jgi:hypothetical protein